jgi:pyruvate-ferredoxin/flavodoxin oxidoreductase
MKRLASLHEVSLQNDCQSFAGLFRHSTALSTILHRTLSNESRGEIIAGRGDLLPVSAMPVDGTFPHRHNPYEKRNLALEIPVWETIYVPNAANVRWFVRMRRFAAKFIRPKLGNAPATFQTRKNAGQRFSPGLSISYQVAPEDCTGCTLCVDICPIRDKSNASRKALNMSPQAPLREQERENWDFFLSLPEYDSRLLKTNTIKGAMVLQPLFEFSGACVGCGETPYVKLVSQLFGDRMIVANATGVRRFMAAIYRQRRGQKIKKVAACLEQFLV